MNKRVTIVLVLLGLALLWLAGGTHPRLIAQRTAQGLTAADSLEGAPPVVMFTTVVLGGFRGLMADILWLRASELQDQGRYFELVQLANWIAALEPRSAEIWSYHAWNMAYNVSIMMADPEDRWRWVQNGLRLLRDKGLKYNPGDPRLCVEIGWLYQYKIGSSMDDAHRYYRRRLAEEMTALLGGPGIDNQRLEAEPERAVRWRDDDQLDVAIMREVDRRYGPLDWREPETLAVYWGFRGRMWADRASRLPSDRMIYQNLVTLFFRGGRQVDPKRGVILRTTPEARLLPGVIRAFDEAMAIHGADTIGPTFSGFLRQAAAALHTVGANAEGRLAFDALRERFPAETGDASYEQFLETAPRIILKTNGAAARDE